VFDPAATVWVDSDERIVFVGDVSDDGDALLSDLFQVSYELLSVEFAEVIADEMMGDVLNSEVVQCFQVAYQYGAVEKDVEVFGLEGVVCCAGGFGLEGFEAGGYMIPARGGIYLYCYGYVQEAVDVQEDACGCDIGSRAVQPGQRHEILVGGDVISDDNGGAGGMGYPPGIGVGLRPGEFVASGVFGVEVTDVFGVVKDLIVAGHPGGHFEVGEGCSEVGAF